MSEEAYIESNHISDPADIEMDKTTGEEQKPMCTGQITRIKGLVHREMDPETAEKFAELVKKVENEVIIDILGKLTEKRVITNTVYQNAVNLLMKQ